jgi:hypothetical protein
MRPAKNVLLTGAGFTKDFGGYLGDEMWAAILSQKEISKYQNLRRILLESTSCSSDEKFAFKDAVETAYERMHRKVIDVGTQKCSEIRSLLRGIVLRFGGIGEERGFIFTLNQDLLLEGFHDNSNLDCPHHHLSTPGTIPPLGGFLGAVQPSLKDSDWVTLPNDEQLKPTQSSFWDASSQSNIVYIKLHGSYGWRSADGSNAMVVGGEKEKRIAQEPLLQWYLHLFREVLKGPGCNLLVIGYSFGDEHINEVIANAIRMHDLRLYFISPQSPKDLQKQLAPNNGFPAAFRPTEARPTIWEGLYRYSCGTASDLIAQRDVSFLTPDGQAFFRDWLI